MKTKMIKTDNNYPFNIQINGKFFQDLEALILYAKSQDPYLDMGGDKVLHSSPEGKQQNALKAAIREAIEEELKPLRKNYGKLYNLCLDYFVGDVSGHQFKKELRPLLEISKEEASTLFKKRRFKS
mgnify:FL=1